jgi:hypothetical protein
MIYITLLILIILFILFLYKEREEFLSYKKCPEKKVTGLMKEILDKNNATQDDSEWDLFIPCGYNKVESELKTINVFNNKQKIFGIDGCDKIVSKNNLWTILATEYGRNKASEIMPESYVLDNRNDMGEFAKKYKKNTIYILKKNVQRKKGIELTKDYYKILNAKYEKFKVVQEFKESFLINNRKFNIRYYVLIVCNNDNTNVYLHQYNKILYTNKKINSNDEMDFASNITNSYDVPPTIYDTHPYNLNELCKLVENADVLNDKINNMFKLFSRAIVLPLGGVITIKDNDRFQLFGIDVIIDENMKPYILEVNKGPDMKPKGSRDKKMKTKVLNDVFSKLELMDDDDEHNLFDEVYSL